MVIECCQHSCLAWENSDKEPFKDWYIPSQNIKGQVMALFSGRDQCFLNSSVTPTLGEDKIHVKNIVQCLTEAKHL